jgi:hypothetical protein
LIEVFETVGPIVHIDYVYHKKMAFISFKTAEAAAKAIGQTFTINGETIVPERRKYSNTNPKKFDNNGYRGSGAGYQSRGPKNGNFKPKKDKPANA